MINVLCRVTAGHVRACGKFRLIILTICWRPAKLAAFQNPGGSAPTSQDLILLSSCINEPTSRSHSALYLHADEVMLLLIAGALWELEERLWQLFGVVCQFIRETPWLQAGADTTSTVSTWQLSLCSLRSSHIRTLRGLLKTLHGNETDLELLRLQHSHFTLHIYQLLKQCYNSHL